MRTVVTGGAGFIGSHLVKALIAHPDVTSVCVLDNLRRGRLARLDSVLCDPRLEFVQGDVRDARQVGRALRGADVVFHLAAQSNVMGAIHDARYCFSSNVQGTYNVLEAAARAGVKRLVFASSREVYGEPLHLPVPEQSPLIPKNDYGASKIAGETYCRLYQDRLDITVLRLANVYGPGDEGRVIPIFARRAAKGKALDLYGGDQVIDFIWFGYVVEAMIRAGIEGMTTSEPVNIASGIGTPLRVLAQRIKEIACSDAPLNILPPRGPEVVRFVADTTRMKTTLKLEVNGDPLAYLPEVVISYRAQLDPAVTASGVQQQ